MPSLTSHDLSEEEMRELTKVVKKVARSVAFTWPETVTADDLEQDLWLHILESPATLKALQNAEPAHRYTLLVRLAHRTAGRERDSYEVFSGNFNYCVDDVKRLLSTGILDVDYDPKPKAERVDLEEGLFALWETTPQYAEAITNRYSDDMPVPVSTTNRDELSLGLVSLTNLMNKNYKSRASTFTGVGSRKVLSNATAHSITTHYESRN